MELHLRLVVAVKVDYASFALIHSSSLFPLSQLLLDACLLIVDIILYLLLDLHRLFFSFFDSLLVLLVLRVFFHFLLLHQSQSFDSLSLA